MLEVVGGTLDVRRGCGGVMRGMARKVGAGRMDVLARDMGGRHVMCMVSRAMRLRHRTH